MGFASPYEVWVEPLRRDGCTMLSMFLFWFALQSVLCRCLPRWLPNHERLSSVVERDDVLIRCCSVVNGLLMSGSACLFVYNLYSHGGRFSGDLYRELPYYRFYRAAMVGYFAWDVAVCFIKEWSLAWKVHGLCSLLGSYLLAFPFSDEFAGYYTGCFELSNGFLHTATIYRTLAQAGDVRTQKALIDRLSHVATICEYAFALLFVIVRVVGGTYVTGNWLVLAVSSLYGDLRHQGKADYAPRVHDETAMVLSVVALTVIQLLQYVWFKEIVKCAMTTVEGGQAPTNQPEMKKQ